MMDWSNLKKIALYCDRGGQNKFYERTHSFIVSNNHIQVNPAGMGLGKTFAAIGAINATKSLFKKVFIATPNNGVKTEWAKEFNRAKIEDYVVWESKVNCCIKHIHDKHFDPNEEDMCNDDCRYMAHVFKNKEYIHPEILVEYNKVNFPLLINQHYTINSEKTCLYPLVKWGILNNQIVIGDFFGFLNYKMYNFVVGENQSSSCLFIDECHLIPERTKDYLTRKLHLEWIISGLEYESIELADHPDEYAKFIGSIEILKHIKKKINQMAIKSGEKEGRYTLNDFKNDFKLFEKEVKNGLFYNYLTFKNVIEVIGKRLVKKDYESNDDPSCKQLSNFILKWENMVNFSGQYFQYYEYTNKKSKKKEVTKIIINFDTIPSYLSNHVWSKWKKVVLLSGTIPNIDYFMDMTGLKEFDVLREDKIESYNIKDKVIIYPKGDFTSGKRNETIKNNSGFIRNIVSSLKGRTIIYVITKDVSIHVEEQIKDIRHTINFCKKGGEDISGTEYNQLKSDFDKQKEAVAIQNVRGRVEGQNFITEDGDTVDNIIIYGYPYPKQNIEWQDNQKILEEKYGKDIAWSYNTFIPTGIRLLQAATRAKRKEKDNPIIILIGNEFSDKHKAYRFLDNQLKGMPLFNEDEIINQIKKRENDLL